MNSNQRPSGATVAGRAVPPSGEPVAPRRFLQDAGAPPTGSARGLRVVR